jgi:hypothetical protein
MTILAIALFAVLNAIALLHAAWGLGVRWPRSNERDLVALVIGATGRTRMPSPLACAMAATAIFAAGCVALLLIGIASPPIPMSADIVAGFFALAVFTGRGIAAYLPAWRKRFSQQPFARYDKFFYAPLCLCVALVFVLLLIDRLGA